MIRTFRALVNVDPGFAQPSTLETFHVYVPRAQIPETQGERVVRLEQQILENIASVPGVLSVAITSKVPMDGNDYVDTLFVRDRTYKEGELQPLRRFKFVSPGLFTAMEIPFIAGRDVTWSENLGKETGRHCFREFSQGVLARPG